MGASLVGDDVWEYQSSEYQEAPSYPKLTLNNSGLIHDSAKVLCSFPSENLKKSCPTKKITLANLRLTRNQTTTKVTQRLLGAFAFSTCSRSLLKDTDFERHLFTL